jgi:transposase
MCPRTFRWTSVTEQLIDVVPGLVRRQKADGRCVYDKAAKAELVRRCQRGGVSVAKMALAHGINANLLRKWITQGVGSSHLPTLLPVTTHARLAPAASSLQPPTSGTIELLVAGTTIRLHGAVSREALQVTLDCLSAR